MVRVLHEPKNSLLKQYATLLAMNNAEFTCSVAAMRAIAREAMRRGTGARGLRNIMERLLLDSMFRVSCSCSVACAIGVVLYQSEGKCMFASAGCVPGECVYTG